MVYMSSSDVGQILNVVRRSSTFILLDKIHVSPHLEMNIIFEYWTVLCWNSLVWGLNVSLHLPNVSSFMHRFIKMSFSTKYV